MYQGFVSGELRVQFNKVGTVSCTIRTNPEGLLLRGSFSAERSFEVRNAPSYQIALNVGLDGRQPPIISGPTHVAIRVRCGSGNTASTGQATVTVHPVPEPTPTTGPGSFRRGYFSTARQPCLSGSQIVTLNPSPGIPTTYRVYGVQSTGQWGQPTSWDIGTLLQEIPVPAGSAQLKLNHDAQGRPFSNGPVWIIPDFADNPGYSGKHRVYFLDSMVPNEFQGITSSPISGNVLPGTRRTLSFSMQRSIANCEDARSIEYDIQWAGSNQSVSEKVVDGRSVRPIRINKTSPIQIQPGQKTATLELTVDSRYAPATSQVDYQNVEIPWTSGDQSGIIEFRIVAPRLQSLSSASIRARQVGGRIELKLTRQAGPRGLVVELSSSDSKSLGVPETVTIAPNQDSARIQLSPGPVGIQRQVTVTATLRNPFNGAESVVTSVVTVSPR